MKTISFFILALCFLSFSCEKEVIPLKDSDSAFSVKKINFSEITIYNIGDYHNQQLDLAYQDLKILVENKEINPENLKTVVIKNSLGVIPNSTKGKMEFEVFLNAAYEKLIMVPETKVWQDEIIQILSNSKLYSTNFKEFFELVFIKTEGINDIPTKDRICQNFINLANQTLIGQEWEFAISSINVYNSSMNYWNSKIEDWNALGNGNILLTCGPVASADLAGAVVGGLTGAAGGSVPLPIVGTVAGWVAGAIGGACTFSIGQGVMMAFSYWFD